MPSLMRLATGAAKHAATRQTVLATNVANADTPGFRARDMASFSPDADRLDLRRANARHMAGASDRTEPEMLRDARADPNGNTVSLEDQVLRGVEASRAHSRAVTIYSASLDLLRASLGRR
ncbi:flagellar basal body protein [Jannaschia formosa]|uniref:flagellar basal body protein n=1 Tax=Jannaschia formosa TaxID=2259592 RepID=UPI000E1C3300|nr:flagellar basal body protein [Jannaschia formosa]TFL18130.1 flagellar biosynthesis protein FlgB [Jannaschia formosa]